MAFRVVLDACVLYPFSLRDTLLRLAELELYDPYWSERILEETRRNLVANRVTEEQATHLMAEMTAAFEGALVPEDEIAALEPAMKNHPKDRHVLAAAKAIGAESIVTLNLKHFTEDTCAPLGIEPLDPNEFLLVLYNIDAKRVRAAVEQQAADLNDPPMTFEDLLGSLAKSVPQFAAELLAGGEHKTLQT
jgi:predicted nucleic acid-binding protein